MIFCASHKIYYRLQYERTKFINGDGCFIDRRASIINLHFMHTKFYFMFILHSVYIYHENKWKYTCDLNVLKSNFLLY